MATATSIKVYKLQLSSALYSYPDEPTGKRLPRGFKVGIPGRKIDPDEPWHPKVIFDVHQPVSFIQEDFFNAFVGTRFEISPRQIFTYAPKKLDGENTNIIPVLEGYENRPATLVNNSTAAVPKAGKSRYKIGDFKIEIVGYAAMPLTFGHHNVLIPGLVVRKLFPATFKNEKSIGRSEMVQAVIGTDFLKRSPLGRKIYDNLTARPKPKKPLIPAERAFFIFLEPPAPDPNNPENRKQTLGVTVSTKYINNNLEKSPAGIGVLFATGSIYNISTNFHAALPKLALPLTSRWQTSDRAEILAVILAIQQAIALRKYQGLFFWILRVRTSARFIDMVGKLEKWKKLGWKELVGPAVELANADLWKLLYSLMYETKALTVEFEVLNRWNRDKAFCMELATEGMAVDEEGAREGKKTTTRAITPDVNEQVRSSVTDKAEMRITWKVMETYFCVPTGCAFEEVKVDEAKVEETNVE